MSFAIVIGIRQVMPTRAQMLKMATNMLLCIGSTIIAASQAQRIIPEDCMSIICCIISIMGA